MPKYIKYDITTLQLSTMNKMLNFVPFDKYLIPADSIHV